MRYASPYLLSPFRFADFKLKAKIDFITVCLPAAIKTAFDGHRFVSAIRGRISVASGWRDSRSDWITIHDPHCDDLQYLLSTYPETEILALEVAVDFFLKDGTNDPERLRAAHKHFTVNLFPQGHQRLARGARRKIFTVDGVIRPDTMKTGSGGTSVYWANGNGREQVRLYVKTLDNKRPIDRHSTRLEITLNRGGCQNAGVNRVCLLPAFSKRVRSYLAPFFRVAAGIKADVVRTRTKNPEKARRAEQEAAKARQRADRAYARYGAAWAAKHRNKVVPDRAASAGIGGALKGLREQLADLRLPENSAELLERWGPESLMYLGISECHAPLTIEAPSIHPPSANTAGGS